MEFYKSKRAKQFVMSEKYSIKAELLGMLLLSAYVIVFLIMLPHTLIVDWMEDRK